MALCYRNLSLLCLKRLEFCSSQPISTCNILSINQQWRERKGLPSNPNKEKPLLDLPDYTFVDGRPTPYGSRQKQRIEKQRLYTAKIIELTNEIDVAEKLYNARVAEKERMKEERLASKLQSKGNRKIIHNLEQK